MLTDSGIFVIYRISAGPIPSGEYSVTSATGECSKMRQQSMSVRAPEDPKALRATGFLARNYYLFNRTTWLDATIAHTG